MNYKNIWENEILIKVLKGGGIVVMPTDTIYGIVGAALNEATVLRIYEIKKTAPEKPFIILIGDINEIEKFSVVLSSEQKNIIKNYWPGPVSIIFDCLEDSFTYLHRGTKTLAFRLPQNIDLQNLLNKTGPLVATSSNRAALPAAKNTTEAKNYFDDQVDLYMDGGEISGKPSKLIRLHKDGSVSILRE
ncbi:MAG: L-threonylcarbamoyladenylate synthase [Candidatus Paceibacterota bacterium]|jgi:L-threonylcarbamoyladenylate synthase